MTRRRKVPVEEPENEEVKLKQPTKKQKIKVNSTKNQKNEPEWMQGDGSNVCRLILSVQKSDCNNTKVITELTKLYGKMGHKAFMTVFMRMVNLYLTREENDEFSPRMMKFFGSFVASFGEEVNEEDGGSHLIIQRVFKETLSVTSKLYFVRARICSLVTYIMSSFSQRAEIDEAIMDEVIVRMIGTFIKDISPVVRQHAIMALQRLQDPENPEDQVTRAYIYHMESDPVSKVRQAAITAIAKKLPIFPYILDRLHDTDEKVRRHTYFQMASVPVKSYKIADRIQIMLAGLYDRSDMVKKVVNNILLPNWIGAYENNYTDFIKAIKLDSNDNELLKFRSLAQDALNAIFKKRKVAELVEFLNLSDPENEFQNCLSLEKTNSLEWLILWKVVIKFHEDFSRGKHKDDENLDGENSEDEKDETVSNIEILPELSTFCEYIEKFMDEFKVTTGSEAKYQKLNFNHCLIVLLEIAQHNDFGDEIGRNRLQAVLKKILVEHDVSDHVVKEVTSVIELLIPDLATRLKFFNDIVTDAMSLGTSSEYSRQGVIEDLISKVDIDLKVKANSLKMEMMELKEQETLFVQRKQYGEAQKVSEKYTQLNEELIELLRPYAESDSSSQTLVESLSSVAVAKKITPAEILKNLRICYYAIMMKGVKSLTQEILQTYNNFVRYHLESEDIITRVWALKTATAYSLLYESLTKDVYIILKSQMFKSNNIAVWETTIGCIIDLLLRYSIEKMEQLADMNQELSVNHSTHNRSKKGGRTLYTDDGDDPEEMDIVRSIDVVQMLTHVLDSNLDNKVHRATLTGLCKLILHGQYCTRDIMSKFLLAYFNPATDAEINQILGIFFESIIRMKKQESLQEALVPTLVTLLEAPYDSPLREVKQETVIKYVIGATRPIFCSNGLNLHNTLALKLIELLKDNPQNKDILKVFSKEFLTLEISDDPLLKMDMVAHINTLLKNITADARTLKNITDFRDILKGTYKPPLKFSSSAMTTNIEDEDAGIPEEAEQDENEMSDKALERISPERFSQNDILDISTSKIVFRGLDVNITKMGSPMIRAACMTPKLVKRASKAPDVSVIDQTQINVTEVSNLLSQSVNIPATQADESVNIPPTQEEIPLSQSVNIPATDEDESVCIPATQEDSVMPSSNDEMEETVIEGTAVQNDSTEEVEIPETPETSQPVTRAKKTQVNKRQLELSLSSNSPLRKNPRNSATPKVNLPTRRTRNTTITSPQTPATAASPRTPRVMNKTATVDSTSLVKTPVAVSPRTPRVLAISTPKTPQFSLSNTNASTPNTDRKTRQQSRAEVSLNTKLTRSASKKAEGDSKVAKETAVSAPKTTRTVSKVIKKTALPVPTKASTLRTRRAAAALLKQNPDEEKPTTKKTSLRQAIAARKEADAAKEKDVKQRPRWT